MRKKISKNFIVDHPVAYRQFVPATMNRLRLMFVVLATISLITHNVLALGLSKVFFSCLPAVFPY